MRGGAESVIQAAARVRASHRAEVQGGEPGGKRAGAFVPPGAGDLLLPEVEKAAGERGRIVVIARGLGGTHGASIAQAPVPSLTWTSTRTMLGP